MLAALVVLCWPRKPKPETRQPAAPKLLKEPKEPKETPKEEPKEATADQLNDSWSK